MQPTRSPDIRETIERLQNLLVAHATDGAAEDAEYKRLRQEVLQDLRIRPHLPLCVRQHRDLAQFWNYIKHKFAHYQERREFLWQEFRASLDAADGLGLPPSSAGVAATLGHFSSEEIDRAWQKALDRLDADPEGSITAARSLVEAVCKHLLDEAGVVYTSKDDLPRLYKKVSAVLRLSASDHEEQVVKQILGGCATVVDGMASLRNTLGDAHGKGRRPAKPSARHARLAVSLAGAISAFLVETREARSRSGLAKEGPQAIK